MDRNKQYLESSHLSTKNKEILLKYLKHCELTNLSPRRIEKKICMLARIATKIGNFDSLTKVKIENWYLNLKERGFQDHTVYDYVVIFRQFAKWHAGKNKHYPDFIEWLRAPRPQTKIQPSDIIPNSEIALLIKAAMNFRDKAYLEFSREAGPRIGELLSMRIKDLEFGAGITRARFPAGKTGPRTIAIIKSVLALKNWLKVHPDSENPETWLWTKLKDCTPMNNYAINRALFKIGNRAKVARHIYPHLFRHTAATEVAKKGWSEIEMCLYFGWRIGSKMPAIYAHLTGRDLDKRVHERYGLKTEGKEVQPDLVTCPNCKTVQPSSNLVCGECRMTLDLKEAQKLLQDRERVLKENEQNLKLARLFVEASKNMPELLGALERIRKGKKAKG